MRNIKYCTFYRDISGKTHEATTKSVLSQKQQCVYAEGKYGNKLKELVTGWLYFIDNNEVSFEVYRNLYSWIDEYKKLEEENTARLVATDELMKAWKVDPTIMKSTTAITFGADLENKRRNPWGVSNKPHTITNNTVDNKGEFKMPKIKNYKYIAEHGVTVIDWTDETTTRVVCDPITNKADQFSGFTACIAKKAMGNGGKMLNEWDRLVVEPVEKAKKAEEKKRAEAERKAEEEKIHAEAKAKREAKKAKRMKQKLIEEMAKDFADSYNMGELRDAALKLATEKYGVPEGYFDIHYGDCDCCKEFDNLDTGDIND